MKKFILSTALALMALFASADIGDTFSVGDLSYVVLDNGTSTTNPAVCVTGLSDAAKKSTSLGTLFIYGSITYGGKPYHVTHIQDYAFKNTTNFNAVAIEYGVTHIGKEAFKNTFIYRAFIPGSIQSIEEEAFANCFNLNLVMMLHPDPTSFYTAESAFNSVFGAKLGVTKTGGSAGLTKYKNNPAYSNFSKFDFYWECYDYFLGDFRFVITKSPSKDAPGELAIVGIDPFATADVFKPDATYTNKGYTFNVTSVAPYAFHKSTLMKACDLSDANLITSIGEFAFYGSELTSMDIPSSVTEIGYNAFSDAPNLKELLFHTDGSMPSLGDSFYGGNHADFKCYVNWKQYDYYKSAISNWNSYGTDTEDAVNRLNAYFKSDNSAEAICIDHPVDWDASGIEAYTVNQVSVSNQIAYTQKQSATPAGAGLLVKGYTEGDIYKLVRPTDTPTIGNNLLVGVTSGLTNVKNVSVGYSFDMATNTFIRPTSNVYAGTGAAYLKLSHLLQYPSSLTISGFKEESVTGDVNGDGVVNVSDVTALVNRILGDTTYSDTVCDINGDGVVNVSDVTTLVNLILG